jgi:hypothetical protein
VRILEIEIAQVWKIDIQKVRELSKKLQVLVVIPTHL